MDSAWLTALLDADGAALLGVDLAGLTVFWSHGAKTLFGWAPHEVLGQIPPIVPSALMQEWQLQMRRVFSTGQPDPAAETQRVTRDGRSLWVVRSSVPVRGTDGQVIGLVDTLMDVTALKRLDEESRALAQVRQRELIAMDLHDSLIQSLYGLVLILAAKEKTLGTGKALDALTSTRAELERVIEETRGYVDELRARKFAPRDLESGLRLLADGLRLNGGLETHLQVDPTLDMQLTAEMRGQLLYVAREAVSNVLRHAQASRMDIELARSANGVRLTIGDDGRGFNLSNARGAGRHRGGLHNMQERVRLMGGELEIETTHGTRVTLDVPLEECR